MADFTNRRAERDFDRNPPTNAPGQGTGATGWDSMEIDPNFSSMDSSFTGGVPGVNMNDPLGGSIPGMGVPGMQTGVPGMQTGVPGMQTGVPGMQTGMPGYGQGNMQGGYQQSFGEKLESQAYEWLVLFLKGLYNFVIVFFKSAINNSARDWHKLGTRMTKISIVEMCLSLVLIVFSVFIPSIYKPANLFLAGFAGFTVGFCIVAGAKGKIEKEKAQEAAQSSFIPTSVPSVPEEPIFDDSDSGFEEVSEDEEESDGWNWDDEEEEWDGEVEDTTTDTNSFDPMSAAASISVPAGQYTRQYLLETFLKVLPTINPNFYKMTQIYEDSDEFMEFDAFLRNSAIQTGISEEKLNELYLESVEQNPFVVRLTITRPAGIKEQDIADGVADCYKRDEHGAVREDREGCYASVDTQVGKFAINIFKCANVMVSLGDVLKKEYSWISDPKVTMPLFWGVNEMGKVYRYDGIKAGNGSMLISGEGRSGKSWKGQSIVAQMSMFMSPKDVNFYFFDNKGKLSDYYYLSTKLPHVRGFCGEPLKYVSEIKKILEREKPIREKAIHSAGVNNINDYNKLNPTSKLPYIYIVVDEMAAAMKELDAVDKELHKEFNSLMLSIVTNLPYFGIRLLLFPHRLVDFIIDKTTAQQISCRAVVGVLDFETLKSALDIRNKKDFPYNLVKPGDMAIRTKDIRNGVATFTKSEVLSDSETTNRKIFDYIGAVWEKLEPDYKPCIRYDDGASSKPARDVSSDLGDYSVKSPGITPFTDEEPDGASIDELLGDDDNGFWSAWNNN
jgi:hypothetical protein